MKTTLYKVSASTGKMQEWSVETDGNKVILTHGEMGGAMVSSTYTATGKNIGRSNATTPDQQANIEAEALVKSQIKNKHYWPDIEKAVEASKLCREPRKIKNYKDHRSKLPEALGTTTKFNGSRACVLDGVMYSKIGLKEEIKVDHLREAVEILNSKDTATFDAEVYAHGLSLQRIRSAWLKPFKTEKEIAKMQRAKAKKLGVPYEKGKDYLGYNPNDDASKLRFYIFDIPDDTGKPYIDRVDDMVALQEWVESLGLERVFKFVYPTITKSHEERCSLLNKVVSHGYEGLVHYDLHGVYEFGKRSTNTQKQKPRYDAEAKVLRVAKVGKDGCVVLELQASDKLDNVIFNSGINGAKEDCTVEATKDWIGQWVNFQYEELSDGTAKPTKPRIMGLRDCDSKGNPLN